MLHFLDPRTREREQKSEWKLNFPKLYLFYRFSLTAHNSHFSFIDSRKIASKLIRELWDFCVYMLIIIASRLVKPEALEIIYDSWVSDDATGGRILWWNSIRELTASQTWRILLIVLLCLISDLFESMIPTSHLQCHNIHCCFATFSVEPFALQDVEWRNLCTFEKPTSTIEWASSVRRRKIHKINLNLSGKKKSKANKKAKKWMCERIDLNKII